MAGMDGMPFIYGRKQPALVMGVKYLTDDKGESKYFSGFISVKLLGSQQETLNWVKWTNPVMGINYGVISLPIPGQDVVLVGWDLNKMAYVERMLSRDQFMRGVGQTTARKNEQEDKRLLILPGELLLRGNSKSSIYFKNDGSTVISVDDTKTDVLTITIDQSNNVTVANANKVSVQAKDVNVKADTVEIDSGNISLGDGTPKEPIIRNIDKVLTVDSFGIPLISQEYLSNSTSVKSN